MAKKKLDEDVRRKRLLARIHKLITNTYPTYTECEEATTKAAELLHDARAEGLFGPKAKAKKR